MNIQEIIEVIRTDRSIGLLEEDISDFENNTDWHFPKEYKEILLSVDGGYGQIGKYYVDFWNLNDVCFYYENMESLEGLIPFASDGCGIAFAFDINDDAIFSIPMDCLEKIYAKKIATNFCDFLDKLIAQDLDY